MADASAVLSVRQTVQQFLDAARTGNLDLFKKLAVKLDDGKGLGKTVADVKDAYKRGAIHFAAREGKTEMCKYLLDELKLDVDMKDEDGDTALVHASRQGHTSTARFLVERGADPSSAGPTSLHQSAGIGNIELLSFLLSKGVDVNYQSDAGTPLIWAAGHGQSDALKVLLEHHANPNTATDDDITPLFASVAAGSLACTELLIQAGANVNVTAGGATPLHVATDIENPDIMLCLLKAGSDPNALDEDGRKPVQVAAERGNRRAVEILFALTSAVQSSMEWTIDGLLDGIQSGTRNMKGKTSDMEEAMDSKIEKLVLPEVSPEAKRKSLESKSRGDDAFKEKNYLLAVDAYTQAIDFDPTDAALFSNRSLCWVRIGQTEHSLADAKQCRALRPDWSKACYREGAALRVMQRFDEAASCFYEGVQLDPHNKELVSAFRETVEVGKRFQGVQNKKGEEIVKL